MAGGHAAARDSTDGDGPCVVVVGTVGDQHLEAPLLGDGGREVVDDGLEQRLEVARQLVGLQAGAAFLRDRVDDRCLQLVGILREFEEQVVYAIEGLLRVCVLAVDLVDDHDDSQSHLERFPQHEAGLRHGPLHGIDQQQAAVRHVENTLYLASEIGMARRIDDIDGHALVPDRGVLREDRDALLTLEVVGVHDQRPHLLVLAERVALLQQGVDQGGLAVIDVRDDRHVADVVANVGHGTGTIRKIARDDRRGRPPPPRLHGRRDGHAGYRAAGQRRRGMGHHELSKQHHGQSRFLAGDPRDHQGEFHRGASRHLPHDPAPLPV